MTAPAPSHILYVNPTAGGHTRAGVGAIFGRWPAFYRARTVTAFKTVP